MKRAGPHPSVPDDDGNRIGHSLLDFFLGTNLPPLTAVEAALSCFSGFFFLFFPHVYYPEFKLPEQVRNNSVIDPDIVFNNDIEVDIISGRVSKVLDIAPLHVPYCEMYAEQPVVVRGVQQPELRP